jgi:hypothetical protein
MIRLLVTRTACGWVTAGQPQTIFLLTWYIVFQAILHWICRTKVLMLDLAKAEDRPLYHIIRKSGSRLVYPPFPFPFLYQSRLGDGKFIIYDYQSFYALGINEKVVTQSLDPLFRIM